MTTGVSEPATPCFGTGKQITEKIDPATIAADGTATSTATATLVFVDPETNVQTPFPGAKVSFASSDPGEKVGATTDNKDGTYSAVITASTMPGTATITVTDDSATSPGCPPVSATATLTQSRLRAVLGLTLSPNSIPANGSSTSTATATVTDSLGKPVAGDTVKFSSSDPAEKFSAVTGHGNGTYTVIITSSTVPETATITAVDTSVAPNPTGNAPLTQTVVPTAPPPIGVPDTGAPPGQPAPLGALLLTIGGGLLAAARWRARRVSRARG